MNDEDLGKAYYIVFDDAEVEPEFVFGDEIAMKRFKQCQINWNCHLFECVISNDQYMRRGARRKIMEKIKNEI